MTIDVRKVCVQMGIKVSELDKPKRKVSARPSVKFLRRFKLFTPSTVKLMVHIPDRGEFFRVGPWVGVCIVRIGKFVLMDRLKISIFEPGAITKAKREGDQ